MSFVAFGSRSTLDNVLRRQLLHQARCRIVLKQTAGLTSLKTMEIQGKTALGEKPWPYEKRPYNWFYQFFDRTTKRMDENSKLVVIDGPPWVGKTALANGLSQEYDLKFIPDVTDNEMFIAPNGYDTKPLDVNMPVSSRRCNFEEFYTQSVPEQQLFRIAMTQRRMFVNRFYRYCEGLSHLFNTGQGVVIERGPHSDIVFPKTLAKFNHINKSELRFFLNSQNDALCELHRPHLYIYIDASVKYMQEEIKKRNVPWEVNSPVLTEKFLSELRDNYREVLHEKQQEQQSEVLVYDAANFPDMEMIIEDIEKLDLEYHDSLLEGYSDKFLDWGGMIEEDDWNEYRIKMSKPFYHYHDIFLNFDVPFDARGLYFNGDDVVPYRQVVVNNPNVY